MISDYMDSSAAGREEGWEGMRPTCDVWGTVLEASDRTQRGSVRVRIKTMKDGMDTFDNVPVLTGYGGGSYGAFFLPEEGDIVRLTFLGGDFRHPIVTGCRFPEDSRFVKGTGQPDNLKKAWKLKNESGITFSGEKGKDKIEISGSEKMAWELNEETQQITFGDKERKNQVLLDKKNGKAQIAAETSICLSCGRSSLELKKDGTVVLECENLTLKAKNVRIQGNSKVELKGQELALEGAAGVSVSGRGQVKISSKGQLKLSGAMIQLN